MTRRKFAKFFSFLIFIAFVASIFLYPDFYKRQVHKVQGMYYVAKGDKALRQLRFQLAIDFYNRGLELYPEHYGAWFNLGNIYVAFEDFYSATNAYQNAIKYNPNYVMARMNYGIVSGEKLGDFDGAIEQYRKILKIQNTAVYIPFIFNNLRSYKTNIGLAYYNMGIAFRQKSIYYHDDYNSYQYYMKEAIEAYKQAVNILKYDYDSHYNLALAYHLTGDYNKAGASYCKAIELEPMNYEAHYNLAILLKRIKHYKESYLEMEKANFLIGSKGGGSSRQQYVFGIMGDVTNMILMEEEGPKWLLDNFSNNIDKQNEQISLNGKLESNEDIDGAVLKNFKTCSAYKMFIEESEDIEDFNL